MPFTVSLRRRAEPLSDLNTTPLIDILLVLLVMLIITLPPATNSLEIPLPGEGPRHGVDRTRNVIVIQPDDTILWNGDRVGEPELQRLLGRAAMLKPEPELQLAPSASAGYEKSARILRLIKLSGVSNLGFVGNERFRVFGKAPPDLNPT